MISIDIINKIITKFQNIMIVQESEDIYPNSPIEKQ